MAEIDSQLVVQLTQEMVRIPSKPGEEGELAGFLREKLSELGFDNVRVDKCGNVIGEIVGNQPSPTILFDAHTDIVGIAPGVPWRHDPFGGEIVGDRLYGRGSADMKGALAGMIAALKSFEKDEMSGRAVVAATVMEEVLEGVALQVVMDEVHPDFVIIGEASELKIVRGGRGRTEIVLETTGVPAHSSSPQHGVNAVEAILPALHKISNLDLPSHPLLDPAVMVLTEIISEPYPGQSMIPSKCRATFDRRLMPGETRESVMRSLADLPTISGAKFESKIAEGFYRSYTGWDFSMEKFFPAWLLDLSDPIVKGAAHGLSQMGMPVGYGVYHFCTNAAYSIGEAGVPTIGFGPSNEAVAHTADEFVEIDELIEAAHGYKAIFRGLQSL
jgi:putative selenium metabolism hydrolase